MKWDLPICLGELRLTPHRQAAVDRLLACYLGRRPASYTRFRLGAGNWWGVRPGYHDMHRLVAELCLGVAVPRSVDVHHLNDHLWDNTPANLVVCTRAWHRWFHRQAGNRYTVRMPGQPQVFVECACGCGKRRPLYDRNGCRRAYIKAHGAHEARRLMRAKRGREWDQAMQPFQGRMAPRISSQGSARRATLGSVISSFQD